jgi:RecG-like helicase
MAKARKQITAEEFEQGLIRNFAFEPTHGQKRLFYAFTRMMFSEKLRCALIIKGYAGTGKTTTVSARVGVASTSDRAAARAIRRRMVSPYDAASET